MGVVLQGTTQLECLRNWYQNQPLCTVFVQSRSWPRNRAGSITAAWISSFWLDLWRKIIAINFRLIIRRFRLLVHYYRPPNTGYRDLGMAQILCRCVHIEEIEMGAPLRCRTVVYDLNYGGKILSSIFGWLFIDSGWFCTHGDLLKPLIWACTSPRSCAGRYTAKGWRWEHHCSAEPFSMIYIMEQN